MKGRNKNTSDSGKESAGVAAAGLVEDGMIIGLGTGSTTAYAISEVGKRINQEELDVQAVVTSYQSEMLAIDAGIPLTSLSEHPVLDLDIDGADQIDFELNAIKGGGAAHTREKVVACSSKQFVAVIDESKLSDKLNHSVPVEILPYSRNLVLQKIQDMGAEPEIRQAVHKDGPVITDNGNLIIDAEFDVVENPNNLASELSAIPGIVEHGIFTGIIDEIYIGKNDGTFGELHLS
ncbi:ribose 5-phosphate isomerase A [Methanohalobium sp.]|uniref:ribose 5-phosphate isomerase A n=1 Tax=Methanohalobium sp. TaxID=2837493 RepID=UPI0025E02694|nr:ribose 5-phosphate isomerase A [Methanohalobium sp.]